MTAGSIVERGEEGGGEWVLEKGRGCFSWISCTPRLAGICQVGVEQASRTA